jgi:hypothetical protein
LFVDKSLGEFDPDVEEEITKRYYGTSQKAIIAAYKDAVKKYKEIKDKYY